jgi:hypothetical protein
MSAITLTHTPADGTLADGTSRGDSAGAVLKANRFRYSRNLGLWYLPLVDCTFWLLPGLDLVVSAGCCMTMNVNDAANC